MTKALSPIAAGTLLPMDTATDTLVRAMTNRLENGSDWRRRALPDRLAPTEAERGMMEARVGLIDAWLSPARPAAIKRVVGMVRGLMASANVGDVQQVLDGYAMVLRPYPEAVIESVCQRFLAGFVGNRVYAPTPAEIAHECREVIAPAVAERARIDAILDAEVYATPGPEDQEKIQARYREYVAETEKRSAMPAGNAPEPLKPYRNPNLSADLTMRARRREELETAHESEAGAEGEGR